MSPSFFLACLHLTDLRCRKLHQLVFSLPIKRPDILSQLSLWHYHPDGQHGQVLWIDRLTEKKQVDTKQMDNPAFIDDKNIPLVQDEDIDYDDYNTPNTSKVDEPSFTNPGATERTSTFSINTKLKTR